MHNIGVEIDIPFLELNCHKELHYFLRTIFAFAVGILPFFPSVAAALASFLALMASAAVRCFDDAVFTTVACRFFARACASISGVFRFQSSI